MLSKKIIINKILFFYENAGYSPSTIDCLWWNKVLPSSTSIRKYFGLHKKAIEASKLLPKHDYDVPKMYYNNYDSGIEIINDPYTIAYNRIKPLYDKLGEFNFDMLGLSKLYDFYYIVIRHKTVKNNKFVIVSSFDTPILTSHYNRFVKMKKSIFVKYGKDLELINFNGIPINRSYNFVMKKLKTELKEVKE